MPWKKIVKIIGAITIGGGIGTGIPVDALSLSPEVTQAIQTVVVAIMSLIALLVKSPKTNGE